MLLAENFGRFIYLSISINITCSALKKCLHGESIVNITALYTHTHTPTHTQTLTHCTDLCPLGQQHVLASGSLPTTKKLPVPSALLKRKAFQYVSIQADFNFPALVTPMAGVVRRKFGNNRDLQYEVVGTFHTGRAATFSSHRTAFGQLICQRVAKMGSAK